MMKTKLSKWLAGAATFALSAILGLSATAATPVAVFTGASLQDGTSFNNITLNLNGNSYNAVNGAGSDYIQIADDATLGVYIANRGYNNQYTTVIIQYSDLNLDSTDRAMITVGGASGSTAVSTSYNDYMGIIMKGDATGYYPIWGSGKRWNTGKDSTAFTPEQSTTNKHTCAYAYHYSNNSTKFYYDGVQEYSVSGLRGNEIYIRDIGIGGCYYTTGEVAAAQGMKIYGIAIFDAQLSDSEISNFDFGCYSGCCSRAFTWTASGSGTVQIASNSGLLTEYDTSTKTDGIQSIGTATYFGKTLWTYYAYSSNKATTAWTAPGFLLRLVAGYAPTISATYAPLTFGGLLVEEGAGGYSFTDAGNGSNRQTLLGDPTRSQSCRFEFNADFAIERAGNFVFVGDNVLDIAENCTVTLNSTYSSFVPMMKATADKGNGCIGTTYDGGSLKFSGAGTLRSSLIATGGAILDCSDLSASRTTPFINGTLTIDTSTIIKLPADLAEGVEFPLATTISGLTQGTNFYLGDMLNTIDTLVFNQTAGTVKWVSGTSPTVANYLAPGAMGIPAGRTYTFNGVGGIAATSLALNGTLTLDPVKTPLKISAAPTFGASGAFALSSDYASVACGKVVLATYTGSIDSAITDTNALFTASSVGGAVDSVEEIVAPDGVSRQLVLKWGGYDTNAKAITVMPLGDSITEGSNNYTGFVGNPNYRVPLMEMLAARGYQPKSVGFRSLKNMNAAGVTAPDDYSWHNGISGQRVITASTRGGWQQAIETVLEACSDTPDIVTFKIGTNDNADQDAAQAAVVATAWTNVIDRIQRRFPDAKIFTATVTGSATESYNNWSPVINAAYDAIRPASCVRVDLKTACPYASENFADALHPSWKGHTQNAEAWFNAIDTYAKSDEGLLKIGRKTVSENTNSGVEANVPAAYRNGFQKIYEISPKDHVATKFTANAAVAYDVDNSADLNATDFGKVAYYVELKSRNNNHRRWVWADMNRFADSFAAMGLPGNFIASHAVTELHVASNDSGIEPVLPDDDSVVGFLQGGYGAIGSGGVTMDRAPNSFMGYDWNDTPGNGTGYGGMFKLARTFDTSSSSATSAQMLFAYNNWSANTATAPEIGIGNFANHANFDGTKSNCQAMNCIFTYDNDKINVNGYEVAKIEVWAKQCGPHYHVTTAGLADHQKIHTIDVGSSGATISGLGGVVVSNLTFAADGVLTLDPVHTPLRVETAATIPSGAKFRLASRYADVSRGKFILFTCAADATLTVAGATKAVGDTDLSAIFDLSSVAADSCTVEVEQEFEGAKKQVVLYVGDYKTNAKEVTIAPFGDSITEGIWRSTYTDSCPNYRVPTMMTLEAWGYKPYTRGLRKVLTQSGNSQVYGSTDAVGNHASANYQYHTGISAQRIFTGNTGGSWRAGFNEGLEASLEQVGVTDVITLKIGTNDSLGGETAANMFEGWTNLVWRILRNRPTTQVVVMTPVKINKTGETNCAGLRALINEYLAKSEAEGGFPANRVFGINGIDIVYDNAADYIGDSVHPNWQGYMKMADRWAIQITNAVAKAEAAGTFPAAANYTAATQRSAALNVPAEYLSGFVKIAEFTNITAKASAWGDSIYSVLDATKKNQPFMRVAYYVERKTSASPDTRFVWVDMDSHDDAGAFAGLGIPTSYQRHQLVSNLHIYSNSSAITNVPPSESGVSGVIKFTNLGYDKTPSLTGGPAEAFGATTMSTDWNDTLNTTPFGAMNVYRVFDDATPTEHRSAIGAQTLFAFTRWNTAKADSHPVFGIGNFAYHCLPTVGNSGAGTFDIDWTMASATFDTMTVDALDYGKLEIWGVPDTSYLTWNGSDDITWGVDKANWQQGENSLTWTSGTNALFCGTASKWVMIEENITANEILVTAGDYALASVSDNTLTAAEIEVAAGASFDLANVSATFGTVAGGGTLKFGTDNAITGTNTTLTVTGDCGGNIVAKAGSVLNVAGSVTGTITVDATGYAKGDTILTGTAVAKAANIAVTGLADGLIGYVVDGVLKVIEADSLPVYHYSFNDNFNKSADATAAFTFGDTTTNFVDGVNDRALKLTAGKHYGSTAQLPSGDWSIVLVAKLPTTASPIFAIGSGSEPSQITANPLVLRCDVGGKVYVTTYANSKTRDVVSISGDYGSECYRTYAVVYDAAAQKVRMSVDGGNFTDWGDYVATTDDKFQFSALYALAGGYSTFGTQANDGAVDELQVYRKQLTKAEVKAIADEFTDTKFNLWTGDAHDGLWASADNWTRGVPVAGQIVKFDAYNGPINVTVGADVTVPALDKLSCEGEYATTITVNGVMTLSGLTVVGAPTLIGNAAADNFYVQNSATDLGDAAVILRNGGKIRTDAAVTIRNLTVEDSDPACDNYGGNPLTITGALTLGTTNFSISNPHFASGATFKSAGGALNVRNGTVTWGGTVNFDLSAMDFTAKEDSYALINATAESGTLTIGTQTFPNGYDYAVTNSEHNIIAQHVTDGKNYYWRGAWIEEEAEWNVEWWADEDDREVFPWFHDGETVEWDIASTDYERNVIFDSATAPKTLIIKVYEDKLSTADISLNSIDVQTGDYAVAKFDEPVGIYATTLNIAAGASFNLNDVTGMFGNVTGGGTLKVGLEDARDEIVPGSLLVYGDLAADVTALAGSTIEVVGSVTGTITVDATGLEVGDTLFICGSDNLKRINLLGVTGMIAKYVEENDIKKYVLAEMPLKYGFAFDGNLTKMSEASATLGFNGSQTYIEGYKSVALKFTDGQNWGTNFAYPSGDWTIVSLVKAPSTDNTVIFAVGGQYTTSGLFCFRTCSDGLLRVTTASENNIKAFYNTTDARADYHVYAFVYDSTNKRIGVSIDGGAVDWTDANAFTAGSGTGFQFGGIYAGNAGSWAKNATDGAIDEFRMYECQLGAVELEKIYAELTTFDKVWNPTDGTGWNTAANWLPVGVPAAGETVKIDASEATEITLDGETAKVGYLNVAGSGLTFEGAGTLKYANAIGAAALTGAAQAKIVSSFNLAFTGDGTLIGEGVLPPAALQTALTASTWTGTLRLKDCVTSATAEMQPQNYGNAASRLKFTNVDGYWVAKSAVVTAPIELENGESGFGWRINNGGSNGYATFNKLVGSGALKCSGGTTQGYKLLDTTEFTGSIDASTKAVYLGTADNPPGTEAGILRVSTGHSTAIPAGATWTAPNGIVVAGTLTNGLGTAASSISVLSGGVLDARAGAIAKLGHSASVGFAAGAKLRVASAPTSETEGLVKIFDFATAPSTLGDVGEVTAGCVFVGDSDTAESGRFFLERHSDGVYLVKSTHNAWTNTSGNQKWSDATNWRYGTVPAAGDSVIIDVVDSDVTIVIDADTAALNSFSVNTTGTGKLTVSGTGVLDAGTASGVIYIAEGAFVKASKDSAATVRGAGTLIPSGTIFTANAMSFNSTLSASLQNSTNWTGTVWLQNQGGVALTDFPSRMGNLNSKIQLTGFSGWAGSASQLNFMSVGELVLYDQAGTNAINQLDGQANRPVYINKLSGDGTFNTKNVTLRISVADVSDFTGSLELGTSNTGLAIGTYCDSAGIYINTGVECTVPSNKTWQAGSITINGTLTKYASSTLTGTVKGSGELIHDAGYEAQGCPTANTGLNQSDWTGTFTFKDFGFNTVRSIAPASFGNTSSKVKFLNVQGGYTAEWNDGSWLGEIVLEDHGDAVAYQNSNGSSGHFATYGKLSGTGTLKTSDGGNYATQWFRFNNAEEFRGTIYITDGFRNCYACVVFGQDISGEAGHIIIGNNASVIVADGKTWRAKSGFNVNGQIGGSGSINSPDVTFGAGAVIDISEGVLNLNAAPTFGSTLVVKVAGEAALPEGNFLNCTAAAEEGLLADVTVTVRGDSGDDLTLMRVYRTDVGYKLVNPESFTWAVEEGNLTAGCSWNTEKTITGSGNILTLGAAAAPRKAFVTEDATLGIVTVAGAYQFVRAPGDTTGEYTVTATSLNFEGSGSLVIGNGVTLAIAGSTMPDFSKLTFEPGGKVTFKGVPAFSGKTIAFTNLTDTVLAPGVYPVAEWTGVIPCTQTGGYGLPAGATVDGVSIAGGALDLDSATNLVCEVGRMVLQIRTAEEMARRPIKLWCVGDSITEGYDSKNTCANYRIQLAQKLLLLGYNVEMLGQLSIRSKTPAGQDAPDAWKLHTGISAQRIWTVGEGGSNGKLSNRRAGFMESLDSHIRALGTEHPDVVLLNIGYNDISANDTDSHMAEGWEQLVNKLLTGFPKAKVVCVTVAPHTFEGSQYEYLCTNLRTRMQNAIDQGAFPAGRVELFDFHAAMKAAKAAGNLVQNTFDNCHPTWLGHRIQAETFLPGVTNYVTVYGREGAPEVVKTCNSLTLSEKYVDVIFDRPIDSDSIDSAKVSLANRTTGAKIALGDVTLRGDDARTIRVKITGAALIAGQNYRLTFTDLKSCTPGCAATTVAADFTAVTYGAVNNVPSAYRQGYTLERTLTVPTELAVTMGENPAAELVTTNFPAEYAPDNIGSIAYYVELVREGSDDLKYVWVDMASFANANETVDDLLLPTKVTHRQTVERFHVYSNAQGILNVDSSDGTTAGFIEFSPCDATGATSGTAPKTMFHDGNKQGSSGGDNDGLDWNDTIGSTSGRGMMQIFRIHANNETEQAAELVFAYNNFGQANTGAAGTKAGEIGFGDYAQHYLTDTSAGGVGEAINAAYTAGMALDANHVSSDYTGTRFSQADNINANAYRVRTIQIWVRPTADDLTWETASGTWTSTEFNNAKTYTGEKLHKVIFDNMTGSSDTLEVTVSGARQVNALTARNSGRQLTLKGGDVSTSLFAIAESNTIVRVENTLEAGSLTMEAATKLIVAGEVTISGDATINGTVQILAGGKFTVTGTISGSPTIIGAGDFVFGNLPATGSKLYTSLQDSDNWTGRATLKGYINSKYDFDFFSTLGNDNSIVAYDGVTGYPVLASGKSSQFNALTKSVANFEVIDSGFAPFGQFTSYAIVYKTGKLLGSGVIDSALSSASKNKKYNLFAFVGDFSEFTGTVNGPLVNGYRLLFLPTGAAPTDSTADADLPYPHTDAEYVFGQVFIGAGADIAVTEGRTWTMTQLRNAGTLSGAGTVKGDLVLDAGSTYRAVREGPLTVTGSVTQQGAFALDCTALDLDTYFPRTVGIGERIQFMTASSAFTTENVSLVTNNVTKGIWAPYQSSAATAAGTVYSIGIELVSMSPAVYEVVEEAGYNFAEREITVSVSNFRPGSKVKVIVRDRNGDAVFTSAEQAVDHDGDYTFYVDGLTPGEPYAYEVIEDFFGDKTTAKDDIFTESNFDESENWIFAGPSGVENGTWNIATGWANSVWAVETNAVFTITDSSAMTGKASWITVKMNFGAADCYVPSDLTDLTTNPELDPATLKAAVLPVKTGDNEYTWYAIVNGVWTAMQGPNPIPNQNYQIDTLFDFRGSTPKTGYLVSSDDGEHFEALRCGDDEDALHTIAGDPAPTKIDSVTILGPMNLLEINGQILDEAAMSVNGVEYEIDDIDTAMAAATTKANPLTLKTNVRYVPTVGGTYYIDRGDFDFEVLASDLIEYEWDAKDEQKLTVKVLDLYKWTGAGAENDHWSNAGNWLHAALNITTTSVTTNWVAATRYPGEDGGETDIVLFPAGNSAQIAFSEDISIYKALFENADAAEAGDDIVLTSYHTGACGTRVSSTLTITHPDGVTIGANRKVKVMGWNYDPGADDDEENDDDSPGQFTMSLTGASEIRLGAGASLELVEWGQIVAQDNAEQDFKVVLEGAGARLNVLTNATIEAEAYVNDPSASVRFDIGNATSTTIYNIKSVAGVTNYIDSGIIWIQNPYNEYYLETPVPSDFEVEEGVTYMVGQGATFYTGVYGPKVTTNFKMVIRGSVIVERDAVLKGSFEVLGGSVELLERGGLYLYNKMYLEGDGAKLSTSKNSVLTLDFTANEYYTGANEVENIVIRQGGEVDIPSDQYLTVYLKSDSDWTITNKISVITGLAKEPTIGMIRPKFTGSPKSAAWSRLPEITDKVETSGATYGQYTIYIQFPDHENSFYFHVDKDAGKQQAGSEVEAIPFPDSWLISSGVTTAEQLAAAKGGDDTAITAIQTALTTPNANGCTPAMAYLLGKDDVDEVNSANFLVVPVEITADNKIKIELKDVDKGREDMWADVNFELHVSDTPDFENSTPTGESVKTPEFNVEMPDADAARKVKYYRIKAVYETW